MRGSLKLSLIALPITAARQNVLFTSSVSYCAPPKAILVEQLDLKYFASNESVSFNVTAASVEANLTVSANIFFNVYGKKPVNLTVDFCHALGNVLCPLPQYNFSGEGSVPLPSDVDVQSQIPSIAYHIPDLEAYAQVTLIDVSSGEVKACVQTTLSNGWSTRQPAVTWATVGLSIVFLGAALQDLIAGHHGVAVHNFLDMLQVMQFICVTGLLDLNYPVLYRSFTLNFAWTIGLIQGLNFLQRSINSLRTHTGGVADPAVSPEGTVNRKLSPYNDRSGKHLSPSQLAVGVSGQGVSGATNMPATVLSASDSLKAGIATYTNSLRISERNAFLTIFFTTLILLAFVALALLTYFLIGRSTKWRFFNQPILRITLLNGGLILACTLAYPIMVFSFYQWTIHDSWFSILASVLLLIAWLASWTPAIITVVVISRTDVTRSETVWRYPLLSFFRPYRISRTWYATLSVLITFATAVFVGFFQSNGAVQVIGLIVAQLISLGVGSPFRPYELRRSNLSTISLASLRLVTTGLLVSFIPQVGVKPIPRVVIGIVLAVVLSVMIGVLLADFAVNSWVQLRSIFLPRHRLKTHRKATNASPEKLHWMPTAR